MFLCAVDMSQLLSVLTACIRYIRFHQFKSQEETWQVPCPVPCSLQTELPKCQVATKAEITAALFFSLCFGESEQA